MKHTKSRVRPRMLRIGMRNSCQEHLGHLYLDMVCQAVVRNVTEDESYLLAFLGLPWGVWFATWCVHALCLKMVMLFKLQ